MNPNSGKFKVLIPISEKMSTVKYNLFKSLFFAGICYKFVNEVSDWYKANKTCHELVEKIGGHFVGGLAKVNSELENEFIKGKLTIY